MRFADALSYWDWVKKAFFFITAAKKFFGLNLHSITFNKHNCFTHICLNKHIQTDMNIFIHYKLILLLYQTTDMSIFTCDKLVLSLYRFIYELILLRNSLEHIHKKLLVKHVAKGKLERLPEIFLAFLHSNLLKFTTF